MSDKPISKRAEYAHDRSKLFAINIALTSIALMIIFGLGSLTENKGLVGIASLLSILGFCFFVFTTWPKILKPAHIELFSNGLSIKPIGFWPWKKLRTVHKDNSLVIQISMTNAEFAKLKRPGGCLKCTYNSEAQTMNIIFRPFRLGEECSLRTFYERLIRIAPDGTGIPFSAPQNEATQTRIIERLIWGNTKLTLKQKILTVPLILLSLTALYHMTHGQLFLPSKTWNGLGLLLVLVTLTAGISYHVTSRLKRTYKPKEKHSLIYKVFVYPFALWLIPFTLCIMIIHGPGSIFTRVKGETYKNVIYVADKNLAKYDSDCGYKIKSPQLRRAAAKDLCIHGDQYSKLPHSGIIAVTGKQSWFGRTITNYVIPPANSPLHQVARASYRKIYSDWEVRDPEEVKKERAARKTKSTTEPREDELREWKKNASSALQSALGWQKLVNQIDAQDKRDAPRIVDQLLKTIPDIVRTDKKPTFRPKSKDYLEVSNYVEKYYESAKALKEREYDVLLFALDNNDHELAEKTFLSLIANRPDLKYITAARLGFYFATHSDCKSADKYLAVLADLKSEPDFFINHTVKPKSGTFSHPQRIARIWSQTAMVCESLESALRIFANHYPLRLTNDQFLLETYVDFAQALNLAGYNKDAARFIALASDLLETGTFEHEHNAAGYLTFYTLQFTGPETAYKEYMDFVSRFREKNPESSLLNVAFLQLLSGEFAVKGNFTKALEVSGHLSGFYLPALNLIFDEANKQLSGQGLTAFAQNFAQTLQMDAPYSRHYLYEPLLKAALYFSETGDKEEADKLVSAAYTYLETGKEAQDKHFKQRAVEMLSKYLVFIGRPEEALALLKKYPEINPAHIYKGWGALYGYYIDNNMLDEITRMEQETGSIGVFTVNSAIDYMMYKGNWDEAERLTAESLNDVHKVSQYKILALRHMGITFPQTFYQLQTDNFQYNDKAIINEKLCRLYNHCK